MKTRNFPVIESYPLTGHLRAEASRKLNLQFMSFVRACVDANYNNGSYENELRVRLINIEAQNERKGRETQFEYGFGGHHAWIKQKGHTDRLIIVTF